MLANPLALIAEITHRCPLHCVYCSNPVVLSSAKSELPTEAWLRVFQEAARLGVLHVHLTGGEPAARADLCPLIGGAHGLGLYTNLITSGIGISRDRLKNLVDTGLDHIQLSFQDSRNEHADSVAGSRAHEHKVELAGWIRDHQIAFTANLVVHRQNLDHLEKMIAFLETLQPNRIEIAHTQYYGWALENRAALMPTPAQLGSAQKVISAAQARLKGKVRIDSVTADYYATYPKACMGGWGRRLMLIDPAGRALPCHAAGVIPGLVFDSVGEHPLEWIWHESTAFQKFRGESWMPEPCRSCERRTEDFGGCRCQAFLLTGDASATDPICSLAPTHGVVQQVLAAASTAKPVSAQLRSPWLYRPNLK
jgi:pyrroloquinoline quinone biosynthesis protein E